MPFERGTSARSDPLSTSSFIVPELIVLCPGFSDTELDWMARRSIERVYGTGRDLEVADFEARSALKP